MLNVYNAPLAAARARVDWSVELNKTLYGKPTLKPDEVILGSFDDQRCQVHRLDLHTGETRSTVNMSHPGTLEGELAGRPVLRGVDGNLSGSDPGTGERLWAYQPSGYPGTVAIRDDLAVVGGRNSLTGLRPEGDGVGLEYNLPVRNATGITLTEDGGVLAQTQHGRLFSISPTGSLKWSTQVDAGGQQHQPVQGPDGTVYTVGFRGTLTALDTEGNEKWHFATNETYVNNASPGENGEVVASTFKGQVTSLEAETGKVRWTHKAAGPVDKTFVHEDGTVFYHNRRSLTALNARDGSVKQHLDLPEGELNQAPDGSLVLSTREGNVQRIVLE